MHDLGGTLVLPSVEIPAEASPATPTKKGRAGFAGAAVRRTIWAAPSSCPPWRYRPRRRLRRRPKKAGPALPARTSDARSGRHPRLALRGDTGRGVACDADQKRPGRLCRRGRPTHDLGGTLVLPSREIAAKFPAASQ